MENEFDFPNEQVDKVMGALTEVIKRYKNQNFYDAKFYLIFIPDFIYDKDDFENWILLIQHKIEQMEIPTLKGSKEDMIKFVIEGLRGINKLKSGHLFTQLFNIPPNVDPKAKETVDVVLNDAFASFYVGREDEAIEVMNKLPMAWFIGEKFWKWKLYIDHWITQHTRFLDRSIHDKFASFVYSRISRILNTYLQPKDQRLRDLEHALEKIERIVKEVDARMQKRETRPTQAEDKQDKDTEKEQPRSDAARRLRKSRNATTKPASPIDTRKKPDFTNWPV